MADNNIKLNIDATINNAEAAKSLGQLKRALLDIQEAQATIGDTSSEEFKKLQDAANQTALKLADTKDRIEDMKDSINNIKGTSLERLGGSFANIKQGLLEADPTKVKDAFKSFNDTLKNTSVLKDGIKGLGEAVKGLGGTFKVIGIQLLTNPIFLMAAVIAAVVAAVVILMSKLGILQKYLDLIKAAVNLVVEGFQNLTDWLGFTTNALDKNIEKTAEAAEKNKKRIEEEGKAREDLASKVKGLTVDEVKELERKYGIEIENEKSIQQIKRETNTKLILEDARLIKAYEEKRATLASQGKRLSDEEVKIEQEKIDNIKKLRADNLNLSIEEGVEKIKNDKANTEKAEKDKKDAQDKAIAERKKAAQSGLKDLKDLDDAYVIGTIKNTRERLNAELKEINDIEEYQRKNRKTLEISDAEWTKIKAENTQKRTELEKAYYDSVRAKATENLLALDELAVLEAKNNEEKLTAQLKQLDDEKQKELDVEGLSLEKKALIEAQYEDKSNKLKEDKRKADVENIILDAETTKKAADFELERTKGGIEEKLDLINKSKIVELELLKSRYDEDLIAAGDNEAKKRAIEEQYREDRLNAEKEASDKIIDLKEKEIEKNREGLERGVQMAGEAASAIFTYAEIFGRKTEAADLKRKKAQFNTNKALQLASATIEGTFAVIAAYNNGVKNPVPLLGAVTGPLYASLAAALVGANIAKIASTKFEAGGSAPSAGGGGGVPSIGGGNSLGNTAAQQTFTPTQFFGLGTGQPIQSNQGAAGSQRVYVTETDIRRTTNRVQVIEGRATIN